jgi:hypothetical protein
MAIRDPYAVDYQRSEYAPEGDVPLWLRPVTDWWDQVTQQNQAKAMQEQLQRETLARQQGLRQYVENLRQSFNPAQIGEAIQQVPEYLQGLGKFSSDVPLWQRALSGGAPIPEALKVMGDVGNTIVDVTAQTPWFGASNVKPYNQPVEQWTQQGENVNIPFTQTPVTNPFTGTNLKQREIMQFATPDILIGGGFGVVGKGEKIATTAAKVAQRMAKVENPIFEVAKLIQEGIPNNIILEGLTSKAVPSRKLTGSQSQQLLMDAINHVEQIRGVKPVESGIVPPKGTTIPPEPIKPQGEAVKGGVAPAEKVSQANLPVGKGAERESEHFRKVNKRLQGELGDNPVYQQVNLQEQSAKAVRFVESNTDDARKITLGLKKPPEGVLDTSISVAYEEKMRAIGDIAGYTDAVNSTSLRATRRGQEIAALKGAVNDNSPTHFVRQAIQARMNLVGSKLPKIKGQPSAPSSRVTQQIERDTQVITKKLRDKTLELQEAQKILDSWACK